jgi:selenocysteine lyase/cysteine desulfurase
MLSSKKEEFSLPPDYHYLNCAYMSPLSKRTQAAGEAGIRREAVPADVRAEDFFSGCDRARELFARLVGAPDPQCVAIIPAASYGLATAALNIPLRAGQSVVTVHQQFPSNVHIWRRACESAGAEFRVVLPPDGGADRTHAWNEAILEAIDGDTAVVALGPVHWTDGTPFELGEIADRTREVSAAFVVDGTQAIGAMPFDFQRIQPDALICAAYKWLTGPYSIGAAYFGPRFEDGVPLEEHWLGKEGSQDFSRLVDQAAPYRPGAVRYDMGEAANFTLLPMFIAALEQLLEWDVSAIQDYCCQLTRQLLRGLPAENHDGQHRVGHLVGLQVPSQIDLAGLRARLRDQKVFVSVRGSMIRVSPHVYNDADDIEALRRLLADSGFLQPAG